MPAGRLHTTVNQLPKKSGNIWDDNQTGAKYKHENNTTALWDVSKDGGPVEDDFIALNDEDLRNQFADAAAKVPSRELGEKGMPSADQFSTPRGELASIFAPVFFDTDQHTFSNKEFLSSIHKAAQYLKAHPKTYIIVEGHCDRRGPEAYNLALGTRRSSYVRSSSQGRREIRPSPYRLSWKRTPICSRQYPRSMGAK